MLLIFNLVLPPGLAGFEGMDRQIGWHSDEEETNVREDKEVSFLPTFSGSQREF